LETGQAAGRLQGGEAARRRSCSVEQWKSGELYGLKWKDFQPSGLAALQPSGLAAFQPSGLAAFQPRSLPAFPAFQPSSLPAFQQNWSGLKSVME
jgi:hypothetical protein